MKKIKKILAMALASSMLLSALAGATIFSVSAAEEFDYNSNGSIDSAEEYVDLVKTFNTTDVYKNDAAITFNVNVDLDLSAYSADEIVIKELTTNKVINFNGHTVSGIVREVTINDHVPLGLIADKGGNFATVRDIKLKDCSLTVTTQSDWNDPQVGVIFGLGDRSFVNNVELENVTVKIDGPGKGFVAVAYGQFQHFNYRSGETDIVMNNVLIDAPNSRVAFVGGRLYGDCNFVVTKLLVSNTTIKSANEVTAETYYAVLGDGEPKVQVSLKEGAEVSVDLVDNATGYQPPKTGDDTPDVLEPDHGYIQFRKGNENEKENTFAARLVVNWDREEIEGAEVSLKLSFDGSQQKEISLEQSKAYTSVTAGDKSYTATEDCALLGFIVTDIPYGVVTSITATLIINGVETELGSVTEGIPTNG